jgi:hypothetical protein
MVNNFLNEYKAWAIRNGRAEPLPPTEITTNALKSYRLGLTQKRLKTVTFCFDSGITCVQKNAKIVKACRVVCGWCRVRTFT